ncbi:hypothetical protein VKT23_019031 [Stygiomarasmius scandens]|uniref:Uncharacterized protein n=1 Tax=Marasmiellus scandens TaxID=2682957 RepID=A0ABR1IMF1_9AGAR
MASITSQKAKFDTQNWVHVAKLHAIYYTPEKHNVLYPKLLTYTNSDGVAWELNEMHLIVWASHIVSLVWLLYNQHSFLVARSTEGVDYDMPPLHTSAFDFTQRLKPPKSNLTLVPSFLAPTPAPAPVLTSQANFTLHNRCLDFMLLNMLQQQVTQHNHSAMLVPPTLAWPHTPALAPAPAPI